METIKAGVNKCSVSIFNTLSGYSQSLVQHKTLLSIFISLFICYLPINRHYVFIRASYLPAVKDDQVTYFKPDKFATTDWHTN